MAFWKDEKNTADMFGRFATMIRKPVESRQQSSWMSLFRSETINEKTENYGYGIAATGLVALGAFMYYKKKNSKSEEALQGEQLLDSGVSDLETSSRELSTNASVHVASSDEDTYVQV